MIVPLRTAIWKRYALAAAFLASIAILECAIYFHDVHHYFQGDTSFWLYYRARSLPQFLQGFFAMDAGGWYRPIGDLLIPSAFYPWFGLQPTGYRIVLFALFFLDTIALFALLWRLTKSHIATGAGTWFFATHTINAIPTYDVAFAPELFYAGFYIASVLAYLRYRETGRKSFLLVSVVFFVGGLFSKESAVTLPVMLVAVGLLTKPSALPMWKAFGPAITSVRWHLLVAAVYLVIAVGYVHIGGVGIEKLLNPPPANGVQGYDIIFGHSVLQNADYGFTWAFNLPRGTITDSRRVPASSLIFFRGFRVIVIILAIAVLFDNRRNWLLLGIAWFLITAFPALLLRDHFLPYYMFLPVMGFSLAIGATVDRLYEALKRFSALGACLVCLSLLAVLSMLCATSIWNEADQSSLLGASSRGALNSVVDLRSELPAIPAGTTVYIIDDAGPHLAYDHASGGLFRLDRNDETLQFRYSSIGAKIRPNELNSMIILQFTAGHLRDVTSAFRAHPLQFAKYLGGYVDGPHTLRVNPTTVIAGKGTYLLTISGLGSARVDIHYVLNDGPVETFTATLDEQGRASFDVAAYTRKGTYRFIGFSLNTTAEWFRSDAILTVR